MGEEHIQPGQPATAIKLAAPAAPAEPVLPQAPGPEESTVAFSNAIRLSLGEWIVVGVFGLALILGASPLWKQTEDCRIPLDHRIEHELSNDYWLYERYATLKAGSYDTLLIGDSVIWGEYVTRGETLSHYLNEIVGRERFGNLGLDGAHPLALSGLVAHYAGCVSGKDVLLQCNPLWMSSPKADLQDEKATEFNHPRLVPQFFPRIPAYKEEISTRLGVLIEQRSSLGSWTNHLQQAYYDRSDIPSWTLEHPYDNPFGPLTRGLSLPVDSRRHLSQPWYRSGISPQDYPWVDLKTSLQWGAFQGVVRTLQERGNRVFVLVGPFNEHLLVPPSLGRYLKVKAAIRDWLKAEGVPHLVPEALPSDQYGDASHPLAGGYKELARQLLNAPFFRK
jgi:hypothetical protein